MIWIGASILIKSKREDKALRKYQFENRTSSGLVGFDTFEESEEFNERRKRLGRSAHYGNLLVGFGIPFAIASILFFFGSMPP